MPEPSGLQPSGLGILLNQANFLCPCDAELMQIPVRSLIIYNIIECHNIMIYHCIGGIATNTMVYHDIVTFYIYIIIDLTRICINSVSHGHKRFAWFNNMPKPKGCRPEDTGIAILYQANAPLCVITYASFNSNSNWQVSQQLCIGYYYNTFTTNINCIL